MTTTTAPRPRAPEAPQRTLEVDPGAPLRPEHMAGLRMLAQGMTHAQIGRRLGMTPVAARGMLCRAYGRLGAKNGTHAVAILATMGWIKVEPAGKPPAEGVLKGMSAKGTVHWARYERIPTGRHRTKGELVPFHRLLPSCGTKLSAQSLGGMTSQAEVNCARCATMFGTGVTPAFPVSGWMAGPWVDARKRRGMLTDPVEAAVPVDCGVEQA